MKETVFDVLLYLFDNYEDVKLIPDQDALKGTLMGAGFSEHEVSKAFDWLEALAAQKENHCPSSDAGASASRIYHAKELQKLDTECRGFLLFLEQTGVLDSQARELAIDRLMALESEDIGIQQVKWVVFMVLFNQSGKEAAITWIEDIIINDLNVNMH